MPGFGSAWLPPDLPGYGTCSHGLVIDTVFGRFISNLDACGLIMREFTSADGVVRDIEEEPPEDVGLFAAVARVAN